MLDTTKITTITKYIFILLMMCLPLSLELTFLNTNTKILWLTEPLCALLSALVLFHLFQQRKNNFSLTIIDKLTVIFVLSLLLSSLFSNDYYVSFKYTISLLWYFCAGYLVIRLYSFSRYEIRLAIGAYLLGNLVLCLFVLNNFRKLGIFYESSYKASYPFIVEGHTDLSVVIEPSLLIVSIILLIISLKKIKHTLILGMLITIFLAVIMFSCSKASYAGLFICFSIFLLILLLKKPKFILKIAYIFVPFLLLICIWQWNDYRHKKEVSVLENSYYNSGSANYDPSDKTTYKATNMMDEVFNQSTNTDKNDSNKERLNRWMIGLELYKSNPVFGVGMGTFPDKYLDFIDSNNKEIKQNLLTENRMNIHNNFLGWLVEGGIITFISGLGLIICFLGWILMELKKGKYSFIKILLLLYMVSFIFHGFFHDFNQNARVIIPFWISLAIISKQMKSNRNLISLASR